MLRIVVLVAVGLFVLPASSRAQYAPTYVEPSGNPTYVAPGYGVAGPGPARLEFFGKFGFAGNLNLSVSDGTRTEDVGDLDLDPTLGGGLGFTYLIVKYFGIGGRFQVGRITADDPDADDGILAFDFALVPRGRFPFSRDRVAVYLALPLGATLFVSEADSADEDESGFNVGVMPGFEFFVSNRFGFFAEVGFQYRTFSQTGGLGAELDFAFTELSLAVGGKLAF